MTYRYRLLGSRLLLTVEDYRRALPPMAWAYVDGGAEDEVTLRRNLDAFRQWGLRQRVLTGVGEGGAAAAVRSVQLQAKAGGSSSRASGRSTCCRRSPTPSAAARRCSWTGAFAAARTS